MSTPNWDKVERDIVDQIQTSYSTQDEGVGKLEMLEHNLGDLQEAFAHLCVQMLKHNIITMEDIDYL